MTNMPGPTKKPLGFSYPCTSLADILAFRVTKNKSVGWSSMRVFAHSSDDGGGKIEQR